jgi:hypothetical protein
MSDLVFVGATLAFFIVAVLYTSGCESLKGRGGHA